MGQLIRSVAFVPRLSIAIRVLWATSMLATVPWNTRSRLDSFARFFCNGLLNYHCTHFIPCDFELVPFLIFFLYSSDYWKFKISVTFYQSFFWTWIRNKSPKWLTLPSTRSVRSWIRKRILGKLMGSFSRVVVLFCFSGGLLDPHLGFF